MDGDVFTYLRAVFALAFVTGLIYLLGVLVKKTGLDKKLTGSNSGKRRLVISETTYLDPKNRLVVVAFERKEYLLLLGASGNLLLESRINGDKE